MVTPKVEVRSNSRLTTAVKVGIDGASANGVQATALKVVTLAKRFAPVDTGLLRSSINVLEFNASEPSAVVGTEVHYADFVEFGTSRQSPQPYMRPAAREGQKFLLEFTRREIQQTLQGFMRGVDRIIRFK